MSLGVEALPALAVLIVPPLGTWRLLWATIAAQSPAAHAPPWKLA